MSDIANSSAQGRLLAVRAAIGLAQGGAIYLLTEAGRAVHMPIPMPLHGALTLVGGLIPVAALGAVGAMRWRTAAIWLAVASAVVMGLGGYDIVVGRAGQAGPTLSGELMVFTAVGLFIAHHLVLAADLELRWIAPYPRYFDLGWMDGVRLALACAFVGAFWLVLLLGSELFSLIGLAFLKDLVTERWFAIPATTVVFALAIHLTDVRSGLVRGIRTLALTLLSWLSPVMVLIAVGFLAALPFTGLKPLWGTNNAAAILLSAAAALIVLCNATYQDGERDGSPAAVLKWTARLAGLVVAPLVAIAAYGVALRIGQHGLTPDRVYAIACLVVGGCYGLGYLAAALPPGPWMRRLEITNIVAAHLAVAVLLAVFSPLADPIRLSVADQVRRLDDGRVKAAEFDYDFLRFEAGRSGEAALNDLATRRTGPQAAEISAHAQAAKARKHKYERAPIARVQRPRLVAPIGRPLPASFLNQAWPAADDPLRFCYEKAPCQVLTDDLDGDGALEVAFISSGARGVFKLKAGVWTEVGQVASSLCGGERRAGSTYRLIPPSAWRRIEMGERVLTIIEPLETAGAASDVVDVALVKPAPPPPPPSR